MSLKKFQMICWHPNLLPEDVRFEHGGAKLVSSPGHHLTSVRPWLNHITAQKLWRFITLR